MSPRDNPFSIFFVFTLFALISAGALFLHGCGGSSGGGQLTINGTLLDIIAGTRTHDIDTSELEKIEIFPVEGALIRVAGQVAFTDANGDFRVRAFDSGYSGEPLNFTIVLNRETFQATTGPLPEASGARNVAIIITGNSERRFSGLLRSIDGQIINELPFPQGTGPLDSNGNPTTTPFLNPLPSDSESIIGSDDSGTIFPPLPLETPPTDEFGNPIETPSPSEEASPTPILIIDDDDGDVQPTATPEPSLEFSADFTCGNGRYNGGQGCGLNSFDLGLGDTNILTVKGFGENSEAQFLLLGDQVAEGTGLVIFGVGDHTCQMRCSPQTTIQVSCTNTMGGSCSQTLVK